MSKENAVEKKLRDYLDKVTTEKDMNVALRTLDEAIIYAQGVLDQQGDAASGPDKLALLVLQLIAAIGRFKLDYDAFKETTAAAVVNQQQRAIALEAQVRMLLENDAKKNEMIEDLKRRVYFLEQQMR